MKPKMFFSLKLAGFAFLMAPVVQAAWAQSSLVTNTNDSGAGSLRYVVSNATNNRTISPSPRISPAVKRFCSPTAKISVAFGESCTINASAPP